MANRPHNLIAIDLGASNGRVIVGRLRGKTLRLQIAHRFDHSPRRLAGKIRWHWPVILREIRNGLANAARACGRDRISSVSCSSWAQDFGLLDADGELFYPPVSYRDERTSGMPDSFSQIISPNDLIRRIGSGAIPVTTLCQLRAMALREPDVLDRARKLLFVADLVHFSLCGEAATDWTIATASQLRNLGSGGWDVGLLSRLQIPHHFLPAIAERPRVLGHIPRDNAIDPRLAGVAVISTAGHDTAVAAECVVPLKKGAFFLSLGTWAMLGCCTGGLLVPRDPADHDCTILGLAGRKWGVFKAGTGLWLLQECRRLWAKRGSSLSHERLVKEARCASIRSTIDPSDPRFQAPRNMPLEIQQACRDAGLRPPDTPAEFARVIFDSLADHYTAALTQLKQATGLRARRLHILGGGSRNGYLCERIAQASGIPVLAGPAEATAIGNIILQAKVLNIVARDAKISWPRR